VLRLGGAFDAQALECVLVEGHGRSRLRRSGMAAPDKARGGF
jgi:hypothetical protein